MQMPLLFQLHQLEARIYIPCLLSLHEYELVLFLHLNRRRVASRKCIKRSAYYSKIINLSRNVNGVGECCQLRRPEQLVVTYGSLAPCRLPQCYKCTNVRRNTKIRKTRHGRKTAVMGWPLHKVFSLIKCPHKHLLYVFNFFYLDTYEIF